MMNKSKLRNDSSPSTNNNTDLECPKYSLNNSSVIDELDKINIDFQETQYDRSQDKVHSFIQQYKQGQFDEYKNKHQNNVNVKLGDANENK